MVDIVNLDVPQIFSDLVEKYQLEPNNGRNHLHGTFPKKIYDVKAFGDTLLLETESPAGEDGFPGNLKVSVRYILTEDNALRMDYRVSSDADTILNLTNHTYFNLDGGGDVLNQKLRLYASRYLEGNNETCPTGNILPVDNTPMDFRAGKIIGRDIDTGFSQTTMAGGGYDHCFVIDRGRGASQSLCAWASSDQTGISMKVYTTQPGVQLYTANFLHGPAGRKSVPRQHDPAVLHRQTVRETVTSRASDLHRRPDALFLVFSYLHKVWLLSMGNMRKIMRHQKVKNYKATKIQRNRKMDT